MTTPESIKELTQTIEFQFSAMVYVTETPDKLEEEVDNFLKVSKIKFDGKQGVFVADKKTFKAYFEAHVGRLDMELSSEVLYIVRGVEPVLLELVGDYERFEGLWGSFEEFRYDNLAKLYKIEKNDLFHLIVFDEGCDEQEMENILIWHTFRERDKFGQGFLISKDEPERLEQLRAKWKLQRECEAVFVKRMNPVTLDKFSPEYEFVGKFTLDDFSRKLTKGFVKPYIVSQTFEDIKGEEDYRLVGNNVDSTYQELNADSAILFYNRNQEEVDEHFKSLRDLVQGTCEGESCGEHEGLIEKIRENGLQMFSLNVSFNDLPSFIIEHTPTILVFKQGQEDPKELKLTGAEEVAEKMMKHLIREQAESESEL